MRAEQQTMSAAQRTTPHVGAESVDVRLRRRWTSLERANAVGVECQHFGRAGGQLYARAFDDAALQKALLQVTGTILNEGLSSTCDPHAASILFTTYI